MRTRLLVSCGVIGGLFAVLTSVHATDPPAPPVLSLAREPAFNPAAPLLGRVQLLDDTGAVVHTWTSPQPNDLFGLSAIITPDVNGDGIADVAIAIPNAFDDVAGVRVGAVVIKSGADGSTITTISGTPMERFGIALFTPAGAEPNTSPTLTVLVEALNPYTNQPSGSFTFQSLTRLLARSSWRRCRPHRGSQPSVRKLDSPRICASRVPRTSTSRAQ